MMFWGGAQEGEDDDTVRRRQLAGNQFVVYEYDRLHLGNKMVVLGTKNNNQVNEDNRWLLLRPNGNSRPTVGHVQQILHVKVPHETHGKPDVDRRLLLEVDEYGIHPIEGEFGQWEPSDLRVIVYGRVRRRLVEVEDILEQAIVTDKFPCGDNNGNLLHVSTGMPCKYLVCDKGGLRNVQLECPVRPAAPATRPARAASAASGTRAARGDAPGAGIGDAERAHLLNLLSDSWPAEAVPPGFGLVDWYNTNRRLNFKENYKALKDGGHLASSIVDLYFGVLSRRAVDVEDPRCLFLPNIVMDQLPINSPEYVPLEVAALNNIDLSTIDMVLTPICEPSHWTLGVINYKHQRFDYYDSLGNPIPQTSRDRRAEHVMISVY